MGQVNLKRRRFFDGLIKISNFCTPLFKKVSPDDTHSYIQAGGGQTGIYWRYDVKKYEVKAIFYLNHPDHYFNEECFRKLEFFGPSGFSMGTDLVHRNKNRWRS